MVKGDFMSKVRKTSQKDKDLKQVQAVNLDLPLWMLKILDERADSLGISRKAMVNVLLGQILSNHRATRLDLGDNLDLSGLSQLLAPEWASSTDDEAFRDL